MRRNEIREEWKKYLLNDDQEYSFMEMANIVKESLLYLRENGGRITEKMLMFPHMASEEYRLTDEDKEYYLARFRNKQYNTDSCNTLLQALEAIYQYYDLTKAEAEELVLYAAENHMTLTDALMQKYGFNINELNEYIESVLEVNNEHCKKRSTEYNEKLIATLTEFFKDNKVFS